MNFEDEKEKALQSIGLGSFADIARAARSYLAGGQETYADFMDAALWDRVPLGIHQTLAGIYASPDLVFPGSNETVESIVTHLGDATQREEIKDEVIYVLKRIGGAIPQVSDFYYIEPYRSENLDDDHLVLIPNPDFGKTKIERQMRESLDIPDFELLETLGTGSEITALLGTYKGRPNCVAKITKYKPSDAESGIEQLANEFVCLQKLPDLVSLERIPTPVEIDKVNGWTIQSFIPGEPADKFFTQISLHNTLHRKQRYLIAQSVFGLEFALMAWNVAHGDIQAPNVIVDMSIDGNIQTGLIDFGKARLLTIEPNQTSQFGFLQIESRNLCVLTYEILTGNIYVQGRDTQTMDALSKQNKLPRELAQHMVRIMESPETVPNPLDRIEEIGNGLVSSTVMSSYINAG